MYIQTQNYSVSHKESLHYSVIKIVTQKMSNLSFLNSDKIIIYIIYKYIYYVMIKTLKLQMCISDLINLVFSSSKIEFFKQNIST